MYFHDQMHFKFILFAPIVRPRSLHLVIFSFFVFFSWLLKLYSSLFLLHFPLGWWLSFSKHCSECTRIILMLCSEKAQVFFVRKSLFLTEIFLNKLRGGECYSKSLHVNPLHANISMQTLHTMLYTFLKVLTRRISLTIKSFFSWWSFSLFS